MKRFLYGFLSVALIVLAVGGIILWEFYLSEKVNGVEVFVAAKPIDPDTIITADHIKKEIRNYKTLPPEYFENPDELIGKQADAYIDTNDVFSPGKMDFLAKEDIGKEVFPIPKNWTSAVPGTLRRGDSVDVYITIGKFPEITAQVEANGKVQHIKDGKVEEEVKADYSATASIKIGSKEWDLKKPILEDLRVMYVKDNSNQEVQTKEGSKSERLNLTANPDDLELLIYREEFIKIKEVVESGYKLILSY